MAVILNLDTSTKLCSVSVAKDGVLLSLKEEYDDNYSHAEKLNVFIEAALSEAKISFKELNAIAVSKGPGSYTGLRIGVSTAKGLCFGLGIPLLAIDTLKSLSYGASSHPEYISGSLLCPMLDARRMEVYSQIFDEKGNELRGIEAQIIDENSFADSTQKMFVFGDGAQKCMSVLSNSNISLLPNIQTSAQWMITFSEAQFNAKAFEDVAYFEPFYLKDFIGGPKKGEK
ncbi:MAG: tRNA (adenosine(37)-N6)-threonylcarbamoyltransferase complex dimerization subunit type 1 TsaB [Bacteroidetes bacterium]|nr:tRNA (adenosine(37)-N6)-threonylcarbamoyltransferase complex dimerization subunit type 1 TsaB [Bacteroidota bacterium]